jgi:predicted glycosyltransferase
MKIWIDIDNSPHVLFFRPIIPLLQERGHEVFITSRNYAQTTALLDMHGFRNIQIGEHPGRNTLKKILHICNRIIRLAYFGSILRPDVSISHGSRALAIASWLIGVKNIVTFDYEHIYKLPFFLFSHFILIPNCIRNETIAKEKFPKHKTSRYPGIKEDISLHGFKPNDNIPMLLKDMKYINVLFRTPATMAHYHSSKTKNLFIKALDYLQRPDVRIFMSLRDVTQRDMIPYFANIHILEKAYDGPSMIYFADLVMGGGGSMNREAAVLNTPCYSIFSSAKGDVDRMLEEQGRLVFINNPADFEKIKLIKKNKNTPIIIKNVSLDFFINTIERTK